MTRWIFLLCFFSVLNHSRGDLHCVRCRLTWIQKGVTDGGMDWQTDCVKRADKLINIRCCSHDSWEGKRERVGEMGNIPLKKMSSEVLWKKRRRGGKNKKKKQCKRALWARMIRNPDCSTGSLTRPFTHLLAPLTHSLALHDSLHSRALLHSLARATVND